jgi:hypothetical protein
MSATVLYDNRVVVADRAREDGEHLWLSPADLEAATGWTLKPVGLCKEEACVPLPRDATWTDEDGRVDLAAFASRFRRPIVRNEEHGVWAFGESLVGLEELESGAAPDFALPDVDGTMHALADYRGQKVFLLAWGSY